MLMIPIVGFLPGTDERVTGTFDALRRELGHDGFISRYSTTATDDGLPGSEAQFLACSFWLVTALAMNGRADEARELSDRLLSLGDDVGLISEEDDVAHQWLVGSFPQALTHLTPSSRRPRRSQTRAPMPRLATSIRKPLDPEPTSC